MSIAGPCPRRPPRSSGFTLLEVMVALAVIAIAFVALLGLHARDLRLIARDEAYGEALFLARELIAEAELGDFPDVGESGGDFEPRYPGQYPGYRWERTVSAFFLGDTREVLLRVIPPDAQAACELTVVVRRS